MKFESAIYEEGIYSQSSIYDTWLRYANERDLLELYLEKNLQTWTKHSPVRILEIGCGSGATGTRIINILKKANIPFEYTGIDPYQAQLDVFQNTVDHQKSVQLIQSSLEGFSSSQTFDIVFAVHSLYYVPDLEQALRKLTTLGKQCIVVHHGPAGIYQVQQAFKKHVHPGKHIISTYQDIIQIFERKKTPFQFDYFPSVVDISCILEKENVDGKKLISFFLERESLPRSVLTDVQTFFKKKNENTLIHDVGVFRFKK